MSVIDKIDEMLLEGGLGSMYLDLHSDLSKKQRMKNSKKSIKKSKLRGFKNRKALAIEIEEMEWKVEKKDSMKFQKILNKHLIDQDITLSVIEAALKLKDRQLVALYDELLTLHYDN